MDKKNLIWLALGGLAAYLIFFRKPKSDNAKNISQPDVVPTPTPAPTNVAPARLRPAMIPTERPRPMGGKPTRAKVPIGLSLEVAALNAAILKKYGASVPNKGDIIETDYGVYEFIVDKASRSLALNINSWRTISEKRRNTATDVIGM